MARWLVTKGDHQFAAQDLAELKQLATDGKVGPADMIQPPGASDWLYASELPELKGLLQQSNASVDDDLDYGRKRGIPTGAVMAVLIALIAGGGYGMWHYYNALQDADLALLGDSGLALTEMLVTEEGVVVRNGPDDGGSALGNVAKNEKVQLLSKRGAWYNVKTATGPEGWVRVNQVVPAYFFADSDTRTDYDPIYNPDRYVFVKNSSWMQLPDQRAENVTLFQFLLQNKSKFDMTDIVLQATIKDKNDKVLEKKEIIIEGTIPAFDGVMIGTLPADPKADPDGADRLMTIHTFRKLAEADPELQMLWKDGIELHMDSEGFVEANIDILQVRAIAKKL